MTWVAWRQWRVQAIAAAVAFAIVGVILGVTGPHLHDLYQQSGITACQASNGDCGPLIDAFTSHYQWIQALGFIVLIVPGLVGAFWGAPLIAREIETHTHRLAWTQSVSRMRWLAVKVAMVGVGSIVVAAAFTLIFAWWASPIDTVNANRFDPTNFAQRGIVPIAYAAFAFAVGITAGAIIQRTLAAMATTIVVFVAVRFGVQQFVRPHFATPIHIVTSPGFRGDSGAVPANAWLVSSRTVNAAGQTLHLDREAFRSLCGIQDGDFIRSALQACAQKLGIHEILTVQPAGRYWSFQIWEMGVFLVLAALLTMVCFWWTRRRIG
jgi:ABC-type transport system involved in multi-copper enzyme maturation permease subunit